jgi:hypothetical protein
MVCSRSRFRIRCDRLLWIRATGTGNRKQLFVETFCCVLIGNPHSLLNSCVIQPIIFPTGCYMATSNGIIGWGSSEERGGNCLLIEQLLEEATVKGSAHSGFPALFLFFIFCYPYFCLPPLVYFYFPFSLFNFIIYLFIYFIPSTIISFLFADCSFFHSFIYFLLFSFRKPGSIRFPLRRNPA